MQRRTVLDFDFQGDAAAVADAWAARYGMAFTGVQDGSRLYEHDYIVRTSQTAVSQERLPDFAHGFDTSVGASGTP